MIIMFRSCFGMKIRYICGFAKIRCVLFLDASGVVRDLGHGHILQFVRYLSHRTPYASKGVLRPMSRIIPVQKVENVTDKQVQNQIN
jgi:hypothetical protein